MRSSAISFWAIEQLRRVLYTQKSNLEKSTCGIFFLQIRRYHKRTINIWNMNMIYSFKPPFAPGMLISVPLLSLVRLLLNLEASKAGRAMIDERWNCWLWWWNKRIGQHRTCNYIEHIWLCFACWLFELWFLLYTYVFIFCRSFDIKRTNHNLYLPIVTISLIHSLFLCLMADQLSDYPMARGSVSEARTGTLDTAAVENKKSDVPSHSLHCIAWGLSNISNTIIPSTNAVGKCGNDIWLYTFTI